MAAFPFNIRQWISGAGRVSRCMKLWKNEISKEIGLVLFFFILSLNDLKLAWLRMEYFAFVYDKIGRHNNDGSQEFLKFSKNLSDIVYDPIFVMCISVAKLQKGFSALY